MEKNVIITISRQFGSNGREIARKLAEYLDISYYNKQILEKELGDLTLKEVSEIKAHASELTAEQKEKFAEVLATKNKGQIMKEVMAELKGKADGKVINQVVAKLCQ